MTKAYTISRLINEISNLRPSQVASVNSLASALSPRKGAQSRKFKVLNTFLGGAVSDLVNGYFGNGKTARTRLVKALRARQKGQF